MKKKKKKKEEYTGRDTADNPIIYFPSLFSFIGIDFKLFILFCTSPSSLRCVV